MKNVLIIHADQHNADSIACYGNKDVKTPNIDMLASEGVRHENHYTVYPVSTPSRYSFISGQYVHQHRGWSNVATLDEKINTFPKVLRGNGYNTACVGKMHLTPTYLDVGYDKMLLAEQCGKGRFEDDYHKELTEKGIVDRVDVTDQHVPIRYQGSKEYFKSFGAMQSDLAEENHSTQWIADRAMEELENWKNNENNLLFVGFIKPHHPSDPPYPYSEMYDPDKLTLLGGYTDEIPDVDYDYHKGYFDYKTLTEKSLRNVMAKYYGTVTQIDDKVGEMIAYLKENNMYDDTMIIYTSDHGDYMGYHHMVLKGNHMYRPLARIPLVIKYPKAQEQLRVDYSLSENIDIASTILETCGFETPKGFGAVSLTKETKTKYVICQGGMGKGVSYMVRDSKSCLLVEKASFENMMFFDLESDPNELVNVFDKAEHQEKIADMKNFLIEKMLFQATTFNYENEDEKQFISKKEKETRTKAVEDIINDKFTAV